MVLNAYTSSIPSFLSFFFVKTIMFHRTSTRKPVTSSVWLYSANREEPHWREMKLARKVCTFFQPPIVPPPISPFFQFPTLPPPRPRFTPGLLGSLCSWIITDFIFCLILNFPFYSISDFLKHLLAFFRPLVTPEWLNLWWNPTSDFAI